MKRTLIAASIFALSASAGLAADLGRGHSLKDDRDEARRPLGWTGFYIGINANYSWGDVDVRDTTGGVTPGPFSYDTKGFGGGLQVGYNQQLWGPVVAGVEIETGYLNTSGTGIIPSSNPGQHQDIELAGGLYGLVAGRLGVSVIERTLIYGKAGYAWTDITAGQTTTFPGYVTHRTDNLHGFVYGGGIEHKVSDRVSLTVEYLRFDLGTGHGDQTSISDPPVGFVYKNTHDVTVDSVKLGLNVKF